MLYFYSYFYCEVLPCFVPRSTYLGINNLLKCLILNMSNQQVWCTIASIAIQTRAFELCSKALIKLEAQDVSYLQLATPTI